MIQTSCEDFASDFLVLYPRPVQSIVPVEVFRYLKIYACFPQLHRRVAWATDAAVLVLRAMMVAALVLQLSPLRLGRVFLAELQIGRCQALRFI